MEKNKVTKAKGTKGAAHAKAAKKAEAAVKDKADKKAKKEEKKGKKQFKKGYEKGLKKGGAEKMLSRTAVVLALAGATLDIANDMRNKKEAEAAKKAGEE